MPLLSSPLARARWAAFAVLTGVVAACAAPDERGAEYFVLPDQEFPLIYRGDHVSVSATLYHVVGADTVIVPNAVFAWGGGGDYLHVNPRPEDGQVDLVGAARGDGDKYWVEAPAFGVGTYIERSVRVADNVELDQVSQDTVAWGGRLTLRGVRVGDPNDVSVRLNGVPLIPDTLSLVGDVDHVEQMSYFVPVGATSGLLQVTGFGLIATDSATITVLPHETFEPNDLVPTTVSLDTAQPYPPVDDPLTAGHPEIHFFEPQLLYEAPTGGDSITADWFHFVAPVTRAQPWTFVYRSSAIPRRGAFGVPATQTTGVPIFEDGAFGFDFDAHALVSRCRGSDLQFPVTVTPDSLSLTVQTLPASGIDFVSYTSNAGSYALDVVQGYRTPEEILPGSAVHPDKFEDNDFCEQADANFALDSLKIALDSVFNDTLTIDTPYEVDWFRFHVIAGDSVTIKTTPRSGFADAALDLYLYQQADLALVDSITGSTGVAHKRTQPLAAGDYYLVVVNTDGQPTAYGLCVAENATCPPVLGPTRRPAAVRHR